MEGETTREKALASFVNIHWDEYIRAKSFLTQDEVDVLRQMQEESLDLIIHDQDVAARVVLVLLKILDVITTDITAQQFALTRIEDILSGRFDVDPSDATHEVSDTELLKRASLFAADGFVDDRPFLRALESSDLYCQRAASSALARLAVAGIAPVEGLVNWICTSLQSARQTNAITRVAISSLALLLRRGSARPLFGQHGGVGYLTKLLKSHGSGANAQLLYEISFCLWTLSFCQELHEQFMAHGTVALLVEQVTAAPREKVVRVSLATIRNISQDNPDAITLIIGCGLLKVLKNMQERQWSDPDIAEDVAALFTILTNNYKELSTFDRWVAELHSKQLKWGSLVHEEKFWRENAKALEQEEFKLLRELIKLILSDDTEVASVACYDLGEFVRFYPNGRSIAKNLGAKDLVMRRIDDPDADVQRHALQCMSKIMVNQWEFMR